MRTFSVSAVFILLSLFFVEEFSCQRSCSGFTDSATDQVEVSYKTQARRGKVKKEVTKAEIKWVPQAMLDDLTCYDLSLTSLLYKVKNGNPSSFTEAEVKQLSAGAGSKWIMDVKPCLVYRFAIRVRGEEGTESILELPQTLGPATPDEITSSGFIPAAPEGFEADVKSSMATLSWTPSDCAAQYELSYTKAGAAAYKYLSPSEPTVQVNDLEPCTNYEVTINALLTPDSDFSEDLVSFFATKPRLDAASTLDVTVSSSLDGVAVSWEAWKSVTCISEYEIEICEVATGNCRPRETVTKPTGVQIVSFSASGLKPCTDYEMIITPKFTDAVIDSKAVQFTTEAPAAASLSVADFNAQVLNSNTVELTWSATKCASKYNVYQRLNGGEFKLVNEAEDLIAKVGDVTPCTEFEFAVSAMIGDSDETEKTVIAEPVMTHIDENEPFEASNLEILNEDRSVGLSWSHAECIESYAVKVCDNAGACFDQAVIPSDPKVETVEATVDGLEPCTQYSLQIVPVITGKVFTARQNDFSTTNGELLPPTEFIAQWVGDEIELQWSSVQCSTGYKVSYNSKTDPEMSASEITDGLNLSFGDVRACDVISYAVATLINEQESNLSEWVSVQIPAALDQPPELKIVSNENDNVTLKLSASEANSLCAVTDYELTFSGDGRPPYETKEISAADLAESAGDITLSFAGASQPSAIIQGRVKYEQNPGEWSALVSSRRPGDVTVAAQSGGGSVIGADPSTVVPIAIGVLVVVVVIVVVALFILRKRSRAAGARLDNGKAEAGKNGNNGTASAAAAATTEETQKLNDTAAMA